MNYSKDGVTVAAMFDSAHPKKSGKCSVKIRVTYNRVRHYYPTGKDLMPAEWDALPTTKARALVEIRGKHGKIDPVGTDEIDPVKTA